MNFLFAFVYKEKPTGRWVPRAKNNSLYDTHYRSWDSEVGIATGYGLDGPGIESRWESEIIRTRPDRPWGPPGILYNGYRVFPGGKVARAWC